MSFDNFIFFDILASLRRCLEGCEGCALGMEWSTMRPPPSPPMREPGLKARLRLSDVELDDEEDGYAFKQRRQRP
jgi:hypothetical protein